MIAEELIAEIRVRTDIVALIGEYVSLKQRGASFVGLCPFHNEKTPSFHVRRDRNFFHCFGCHESGDALAFLMRLDGLTFPQAARTLAERAGLDLPETDDREDYELRRERERHQRLCALMEVATAFYEAQLTTHRDSAAARAELEARGVKPETRAKFRLGYAPLSWDALATYLDAKGHSLEDAEQLGLLARRREGRGYYDRFRHRLMFPVADVQGRIVAFSGRILPEPAPRPGANGMPATSAQPAPKYVNSPESPIYKKGELLFGLHAARVEVRRNGWAIVCEGNFDLLALHQSGFENAVAPLGTAFTAAQARLIRRFAQRVTLMFDGDNAGRKAVHAAYPLLRAAELTGRVARLPPGEDPDTYLRKHGPEGLKNLVESAIGIVEYVIDATAAAAGPDAEARATAIQSLGPLLVSAANPVEIELYIQRIAQRFSLTDLGVVKEQLRRGVRSARSSRTSVARGADEGRANVGQRVAETKVASRQERVKLPELALQRDLLGALLDKPELFRSDYAQRLRELLTAEDLQAIFSAAAAQVEEFGAIDGSRLVAEVQGNEAAAWLRERLSDEKHPDQARAEEFLRSGIPLLQKRNIERESVELAARIQQARQHGDVDLAIALTKQRDAMLQTVKGLKR